MDNDFSVGLQNAIKGIKSGELRELVRATAADKGEQEAHDLASKIRENQGVLGWQMFTAAAGLIIALIAILVLVPTNSALVDVNASRPVLMLLIVISTVTLGAAMIYAAFYKEGIDASRFGQGREIFLFFSGICATVVGFYFGTGANDAAGKVDPTVSPSISAVGDLVVDIVGGSPPFSVTAKGKGYESALIATSANRFTLGKNAEYCPSDAKIFIADSGAKSYAPTSLKFTKAALAAAGWTACSTTPPKSNSGQTEAASETTNTQAAAGAPDA